MSAPPSYDSPSNPDTRPLPAGWITQFDGNYKAWFYVNTRANPPHITWEHPLGPAPPAQYAPPSGPPPPNNSTRPGYGGDNKSSDGLGFPQADAGYRGAGGPGYGSGPPPQQGGYGGYGGGPGYGGPPQQGGYGGGYGQPPPQHPQQYGGGSTNNRESKGLFGGLFGKKNNNQGGGYPGAGGGYGQPPPQVVYAQAPPPQKQGVGMGGMLAAGGAGLLGGALLANAFDNDDRGDVTIINNNYGDDYGGGDYGGGDDFGGDF